MISLGMGTNYAFANNTEVTIKTTIGSSVPGCEDTFQGCYTPNNATVDIGGTVIFSNIDSAAHTFTSGTVTNGPSSKFDSGLIGAGEKFSHKFDKSGTYSYFCMVHPWMGGTIIVENTFTKNNSKCGTGTVFDSVINSCVLITIPKESENAEEDKESLKFDIRKNKYVAHEAIWIDGYVKYHKNPPYINIKILENNGMLVENVYVLPGKDNYFFYHTKASPTLWEIPMSYTVKVTYDGKSIEKYFDVVNHSKDYDPQSVESLQTKLAKLMGENHNLQQKIQKLEKSLNQKETEMENMFCKYYTK